MICDVCGKTINDQYFNIRDQGGSGKILYNICLDCNQKFCEITKGEAPYSVNLEEMKQIIGITKEDVMDDHEKCEMASVCSNCGAILEDGQAFCHKCGTPKGGVKKNVCGKCGAELQDGHTFCPKCGQKAGLAVDAGINSAINQFNVSVLDEFQKKRTLIIKVVVAIVTIVIIVILVSGVKKDFKIKYSDIADESWCTIASDGTWMKIDTNPYDIDDYHLSSAWYKIKSVLSDLGFSTSVAEEMNETTALMGKQSASADGYEVTWSYHPDRGLEAMFKIDD